MEKYVGKHAVCMGREEEVVGYAKWANGLYSLIIDSSQGKGWTKSGLYDVVFKKCERYWYVSINDLID